MVEAYLKCKYRQNRQMPLYHIIQFNYYDKNVLSERNYEPINNADLIKLIDKGKKPLKEGLTKVLIYNINHRKKVLVGIQNAINYLIYQYYVPRANVMFHIPKEKVMQKNKIK